MILFPDVAYQSLDNVGIWKIMIHGWKYKGNKRKDCLGFSTSQIDRTACETSNESR